MNSENALFFGNRRPIGEELQSTCYNTPIRTLLHSRHASENTDNPRMANINIHFKFITAESFSVRKDENSNTIIVSHPRIIMPTDQEFLIFYPQIQPVTERSTRNGLIGYIRKTVPGLYESNIDPIVKQAMNLWKVLQPQGPTIMAKS